ncbi:hypothetical protein CVT26_013331 [Gymnopilus dilepis]|uniref:Uncharacterized protein n=1 Tax=Gymnopilus dilepis TaxID=231916 RepID=A0A409YF27_9AGAR|nr:hypothetical protein CVT26_013331 [Gymnopilus dilepis]
MIDPDLAEFLVNNDPVPEGSLLRTRCLLSAPVLEITNIESQILALKSRLDNLRTRCSQYQIITSPIRNVPDDVLQEIFSQCLTSHRNPLLSASEAPLLLTCICRRWRKLAISTPHLWAQVHITFCDDYSSTSSAPLGVLEPRHSCTGGSRPEKAFRILTARCNLLRKWIDRSGSTLLSISVLYSSATWDFDPSNWQIDSIQGDPTNQLFEIITRSLHRIKRLELHMPLEIYCKLDGSIRSTTSNSLSSLTSLKLQLHLQGPHSPGSDLRGGRVSLFKAPHLTSLSINGPALTFSDFFTTLFFPHPEPRGGAHSITHLCFNVALTPAQNHYILKHCPNLIHCKISVKPNTFFDTQGDSVILPDGEAALSNTAIMLPRLQSLSIWEHTNIHLDYTAVKQLYTSIDAPELVWINYENQPYLACHERIAMQNPTPSASDQDVDPLFAQSSPILPLLEQSVNLKKLTFDPRFFDRGDAGKALEFLSPTLTHLVFGQEGWFRRPRSENGGHLPSPENIGLLEWLSGSVDANSSFTDVVGASQEPMLLPHLKVFELSAGIDSDEQLLRFIKARIIAASHGRCAPLEQIRLRFHRMRQVDIESELASFTAGLPRQQPSTLRLDLEYLPQAPTSTDPLSASYGVDPNDKFWNFSSINESVRKTHFIGGTN